MLRLSYFEMRRVLCLLLVSVCLPVFAEIENYPVEAYPFSSVADSSEESVSFYQLILSTPKKINNTFQIENSKNVSGFLRKDLVEIQDGHDSDKVFAFYLDQLRDSGGEVHYQCRSRACGVSSHWASTIFEDRRLTARDSEQRYYIGEWGAKGSGIWNFVYIVTRGNKKVYAMVGLLQENGKIPAISTGQEEQSYDWSNGVIVDDFLSSNQLSSLRTLLSERAASQILVIAFDTQKTNFNENLNASASSAERFAKRLSKEIAGREINSLGVGNLAAEFGVSSNEMGILVKVTD